MPILKNKTQGNYITVSRQIMKDKELSLVDRGLLVTLLSLPDGWNLSNRGLQTILPDGRDKIAHAMNRLIDLGYVTREQGRAGNRYGGNQIEVHDIPQETAISQQTGFPSTENPCTEITCTEKPQQYKTNNITNNNHTSNKECSTGTLTPSEYDELVNEYGKADVDYQLQRIRDHHYKGCDNYPTIKAWCEERRVRAPASAREPKTSFNNYTQRSDYDFEALEAMLVCN